MVKSIYSIFYKKILTSSIDREAAQLFICLRPAFSSLSIILKNFIVEYSEARNKQNFYLEKNLLPQKSQEVFLKILLLFIFSDDVRLKQEEWGAAPHFQLVL